MIGCMDLLYISHVTSDSVISSCSIDFKLRISSLETTKGIPVMRVRLYGRALRQKGAKALYGREPWPRPIGAFLSAKAKNRPVRLAYQNRLLYLSFSEGIT